MINLKKACVSTLLGLVLFANSANLSAVNKYTYALYGASREQTEGRVGATYTIALDVYNNINTDFQVLHSYFQNRLGMTSCNINTDKAIEVLDNVYRALNNAIEALNDFHLLENNKWSHSQTIQYEDIVKAIKNLHEADAALGIVEALKVVCMVDDAEVVARTED